MLAGDFYLFGGFFLDVNHSFSGAIYVYLAVWRIYKCNQDIYNPEYQEVFM